MRTYLSKGGHLNPFACIDVGLTKQLNLAMLQKAPALAWQALTPQQWRDSRLATPILSATMDSKSEAKRRRDRTPDFVAFIKSVEALDRVSSSSAREKKKLLNGASKDTN